MAPKTGVSDVHPPAPIVVEVVAVGMPDKVEWNREKGLVVMRLCEGAVTIRLTPTTAQILSDALEREAAKVTFLPPSEGAQGS